MYFYEILALAVVFAIGYHMILENELAIWWQEQIRNWFTYIRKYLPQDNNLVIFLGCVGIPAVVVGLLTYLIQLLFDNSVVYFVICVLVLIVSLRIHSFMYYQPAVVEAVYTNDADLALRLASEWEGYDDSVEESKERFASRMLSTCATRLHEDVIAVMLWFVLLGPAGAVMATAHNIFYKEKDLNLPRFNIIDLVGETVTKVIFSLCGNMSSGMQAMHKPVVVSALAAGDINPDKIDLELVRPYGRMLKRALFCGILGAVAALLVLN